jgi:hypothetical protein
VPISTRNARTPLGVQLSAQGMRHPVTQLRDNPAEAARLFASLPPIWSAGGALRVRGAGRSLLDFQIEGEGPRSAFAVTFAERGKSAWMAGRGWWRWRLTAVGTGVSETLYPEFMNGLVRWLAEPAVRERFHVEPGKRVYSSGEAAGFAAALYDAAFAPVDEAVVEIRIFEEGDSTRTELAKLTLGAGSDPGSYEGEGPSLPAGAYRFEATASAASGTELGRTEGKFWVEPMGPEFARTGSDRDLLRQIAAQSHGKFADLSSVPDLIESIPSSIRQIMRVREIDLWNHWILFALFVLVLSTEWFLRRRRGLA